MSFNVFAEWALVVATFAVPLGLYLIWHAYHKRLGSHVKSDRARLAIGIVCWFLGLELMFLSQQYKEREWRAMGKHLLPPTEESLAELGDGPNVMATWVYLGWIPIFGASRIARYLYS